MGVNLNLAVLRIHMLHKLYLVVMDMYGGPLENIQHVYLYGSVTRLYGIIIQYWMKLGCINFSFPYLTHACMKEAMLGF